jgi:aspartate 1-decarboxylase
VRIMLKSKIHRARVTRATIDYEGSISIDKKLMEEADILPYEQVQVLNLNNGARFTTYAIEAESGEIGINGAAARLVAEGDTMIILSYRYVEENEIHNFGPKLVYVDAKNAIIETKQMVEAVPLWGENKCA